MFLGHKLLILCLSSDLLSYVNDTRIAYRGDGHAVVSLAFGIWIWEKGKGKERTGVVYR